MSALLPRAAFYWFALTTVPFWLVTIRGAFDGSSYQWGLFGHSGRGMGGAYWFPLTCALLALMVMVSGWLGRRWAFVVLVLWNVLLLAAVLLAVRSSSEEIRFRGDTLGVDVTLAVIGPAIFGVGALISIAAVLRAFRSPAGVNLLGGANRLWLIAIAVALPIQFVLLRFGSDGSLSDQIGVVITILQWLFLGRALAILAQSYQLKLSTSDWRAQSPKPRAQRGN